MTPPALAIVDFSDGRADEFCAINAEWIEAMFSLEANDRAILLARVVAEAHAMRPKRVYLLTNRKCAAAIHLYEKAGFVHDARVMADYGGRYARTDIAMSLPLAAVTLPLA